MNIGNERNEPKRGFGKGRIESLFTIAIVLSVVLLMSAIPAVAWDSDPHWVGWLEPQDSSGTNGADTLVELWVTYDDTGLTYGAVMYQWDLYFDPNCVNITDADFSDSPFASHMFTPYAPGVVRILEDNMASMTPITAGTYKMATLTLHGECTSDCTCDLWFDPPWCVVSDTDGEAISRAYTNGTYTCGVPMPNLNVTTKSETLTGDQFTVTYTVENNGGGDAGESTTCIYVDGIQVATDPVGALAAGATYEGTVVIDPFDCPCGTTVTVTVCADNDDVVDESDETNNCLNNTFDCPLCSKPDLVIINKSETLDLVTDTFTVTYTVENIGGGNAGASTTSITNGTTTLTDSVPELASGESHEGTVGPFNCPCGTTVTVTVCADMDNVVEESDETNNCMQNDCTCESCLDPDLNIMDKHEEWVDQLAGTYNITYTVTNIGGAEAVASTTSIAIDGSEVATDSVPALAAGGIHTATLGPYTMSDDSDIIEVCADRDNVVDESDEGNNCEDNMFTYTAVINVSISPCQVSIGSDSTNRTSVFIILENIENYGSGTIDLEFDESVVEVDTITAIGCDSDTVTPNKVGQGHWKITAVSDDGEDNSVKFANVTFKPSGLPPQCSDLDLTVVTLYDTAFNKLHDNPGTSTKTCEICIFELDPDPPGVTDPVADPQRILNTNGRARVPGTRLSDLSVYVTDDTSVASVTIDLTQILLGAGNATVPMVLQSGTNMAGTWHNVTYADRDDDLGTLTPPNPDLPGVNLTHQLYVNATDGNGNSNTGECINLTVLRRGDVVRDDFIDSADYLYIMMYTVDLVPAPDELVAGVVPADSWDGVDAGDALYIAMHTVGLVDAP